MGSVRYKQGTLKTRYGKVAVTILSAERATFWALGDEPFVIDGQSYSFAWEATLTDNVWLVSPLTNTGTNPKPTEDVEKRIASALLAAWYHLLSIQPSLPAQAEAIRLKGLIDDRETQIKALREQINHLKAERAALNDRLKEVTDGRGYAATVEETEFEA